MAELQKREKIMLVATGSVLVAFLLYQFVFTETDAPAPQAAGKTAISKTTPLIVQRAAKGEMVGETGARNASFTLMDWGRDPFHEAYRLAVFDTSQTDSTTRLVLKGIIWKGNRAFVLINDVILMKGQKSGNLKVLDIKKERVICKQGNNMVTLFLDDEK